MSFIPLRQVAVIQPEQLWILRIRHSETEWSYYYTQFFTAGYTSLPGFLDTLISQGFLCLDSEFQSYEATFYRDVNDYSEWVQARAASDEEMMKVLAAMDEQPLLSENQWLSDWRRNFARKKL
jgi:hypothetical protein